VLDPGNGNAGEATAGAWSSHCCSRVCTIGFGGFRLPRLILTPISLRPIDWAMSA
jgi:hypothetical protein